MVSRQHQQHRVLTVLAGLQGRQGNGRSRIATYRLQQNAGVLHIQLAQLLCGKETMLFIADQLWRRSSQPAQSQDSGLQHRHLGIGQRQELLWVELTRQRPQARACTASNDYWKNHLEHPVIQKPVGTGCKFTKRAGPKGSGLRQRLVDKVFDFLLEH